MTTDREQAQGRSDTNRRRANALLGAVLGGIGTYIAISWNTINMGAGHLTVVLIATGACALIGWALPAAKD